MYLKNALILECGSLKDLEVNFEFTKDGLPKPTLIVGENGSDKSTFLSFIDDALIEIAAKKFDDVTPAAKDGKPIWHRTIGSDTMRSGSHYEAAFLNFSQKSGPISYASKGGTLERQTIQNRLDAFPGVHEWPEKGPYKSITFMDTPVSSSFR